MNLLKRTFAFFKTDPKTSCDTKTHARLNRFEAAQMMKCSISTLNTYASAERGPKVHKDTCGIYYKPDEVAAYMANKYATRNKRVKK